MQLLLNLKSIVSGLRLMVPIITGTVGENLRSAGILQSLSGNCRVYEVKHDIGNEYSNLFQTLTVSR